MKVAINACYGGFGLSDVAFERLLERKGIEFEKHYDEPFSFYYEKGRLGDEDAYLSHYDYYQYEARADPDLVAVIEEMGQEADGNYANLKIVEIPDDIEWYIEENEGFERVAEKHRTWS